MVEGFYAVYYTGVNGSGHFSMVLKESQIVGLEGSGAILKGTYSETVEGGVSAQLVFNWPRGISLVTGQTLETDLSIPFGLTILAETFAGQTQLAEMPIGKVNFRIEKLLTL